MKKDHNVLLCRIVGMVLSVAVLIPGAANAGPPFRTDDPEPVEYQHYEFTHSQRAPTSAATRQGSGRRRTNSTTVSFRMGNFTLSRRWHSTFLLALRINSVMATLRLGSSTGSSKRMTKAGPQWSAHFQCLRCRLEIKAGG